MLAALEQAREAERRFVADASHELRTPITALRGNAAYLQAHGADPETLADLHADAERLSRLLDDLLALAREDAGGVPDEPVDLSELAREAAAGDAAVAVEADGPALVRGDRRALERALGTSSTTPSPRPARRPRSRHGRVDHCGRRARGHRPGRRDPAGSRGDGDGPLLARPRRRGRRRLRPGARARPGDGRAPRRRARLRRAPVCDASSPVSSRSQTVAATLYGCRRKETAVNILRRASTTRLAIAGALIVARCRRGEHGARQRRAPRLRSARWRRRSTIRSPARAWPASPRGSASRTISCRPARSPDSAGAQPLLSRRDRPAVGDGREGAARAPGGQRRHRDRLRREDLASTTSRATRRTRCRCRSTTTPITARRTTTACRRSAASSRR